MFEIGLDLGYGYVKGVNEAGKGIIFPSLVGNAYDRPLAELFGNDEGKRTDNMHLILTGKEKEEFFVGELARRESRSVSYAFDENKINHPNTSALLAASCLLLFPDKDIPIHLVTGLPLEQYVHKKDEFREKLLDYRRIAGFKDNDKIKIIKFDKVTIFPQAAGAVYYAILDELKNYKLNGSYIGLVDIGFKTTDYIVFAIDRRLALREDLSGTVNIGMSNLHNAADKIFTQKTGAKLDIPELMFLLAKNRIFFRGQDIEMGKELSLVKSEISKVIKDRLKSVWGSKLDFFSTVFLAGGGGKELFPFLIDIHPNSALIHNAQFANAKGFLKVARLGEKEGQMGVG
jgi:plasmid segregation protein ParM